jgi:nucleoside-diphosphate-sugar epimerase
VRILVTGAAGYIGSALVRALAARGGNEDIVATDQSEAPAPSPRVQAVRGNLAYPRFTRDLIKPDTGMVFHLAALVSGGAEQNFELGTKVNLDATRDLLEACRLIGHRPRFVFASSIAVYGGPLPDPVTDDTPAAPRLSYGAQKLVCEVLLDDYTRRGYVDACALRLPAVLVRPGAPNTALSGWSSAVVREPIEGRDYVCPVRPDTRLACLSLDCLVKALLHAADLPPSALGERRTVLLNSVSAAAGELWEAARPHARGHVRFEPDDQIQAVMDGAPKATRSARAQALGFPVNSGVGEIVAEYLRARASATN